MKNQHNYIGLVVLQNNETLVETLHSIQNLVLDFCYQHEISGIFYYANQAFYHCLEGNPDTIRDLYSRIDKLNKLKSIIYIDKECMDFEPTYTGWSMKYVTKKSIIIKFFNDRNILDFEPLKLDKEDLCSLVDVIKKQYATKNNKIRFLYNH